MLGIGHNCSHLCPNWFGCMMQNYKYPFKHPLNDHPFLTVHFKYASYLNKINNIKTRLTRKFNIAHALCVSFFFVMYVYFHSKSIIVKHVKNKNNNKYYLFQIQSINLIKICIFNIIKVYPRLFAVDR